MILYLKYTIPVCFLIIYKCAVGFDNKDDSSLKKRTTREEITDITKTLTDDEIELALSDLTLSDLSALSKLIDSSNDAEYADGVDSFLDSNQHLLSVYELKNDGNENVDLDDNEPQAVYQQNAFKMSDEVAPSSLTFLNEIARAKREDSQKEDGNDVDEEYLKLLENSFPHGSDQNDIHGGDSEIKKDHIRVKRPAAQLS